MNDDTVVAAVMAAVENAGTVGVTTGALGLLTGMAPDSLRDLLYRCGRSLGLRVSGDVWFLRTIETNSPPDLAA